MNLVSFDLETWGLLPEYALQPYRARTGDAWITSFATDGGNAPAGELSPSKETLRAWLQDCAEFNKRIVGWNTAFDVAWLIAVGLREEVYKCKWLDAMLMWRHLTVRPEFAIPEGLQQNFSLKNAVRTYIPEHANYEDGVSFDPNDDPEKLLEYNKLDAQLTLQLAQMFWERMTPQMRKVAQIEAAAIPMVAEVMVEGLCADANEAQELANKLQSEADGALVRLMMTEGTTAITREMLNSTTQLSNLLVNKWGLSIPKLTPKGSYSTDKEVLWMLAHEDPRARMVKEHREALGNKKKFADNVLESLAYNGDGRVRPQFRIAGTYTGRMTVSSKQGKGKSERQTGIALHQWKRDPEFRKTIKPPPGYTLLEFDFAGQEYRWMAVMSCDPVMLQLCQPGEDPHTYMGAQIAHNDYRKLMKLVEEGNPEAKKFRQRGKVANLSLQYRTSAKRLRTISQVQYDLPMSEDEAQAIHLTYRTTYRYVPRYWQRQIRHMRANGYVENLLGRRVYLGQPHEWKPDLIWSYESTAINFPIQSIGAEQKYLALMVLRELLPEYDGRFYFELHDGIFVIVPSDKAEKAAAHIKRVLSNLPYTRVWGYQPPVPFPVDAKLGPSWGELKEFHA